MIERALEALEDAGERELLAVLAPDGAVVERRSGAELLGEVGAWQAWLRARGISPGERVAIDLPRVPALLAAHLAVLASGACVVPLNPALSAQERRRVLERAEAVCTINPQSRPDRSATPQLAAPDPRRPALLIFTSGTTGEPKGVPHSLSSLDANLDALAHTWGLSRDDRLLHALPAHHVHGLVLGLYGSARLGLPVLLLPRFDAALCLRSFGLHEASVFMGVPTMYHRLVRCEERASTAGVRLFISGSAPLSPADFQAFEKRFGQAPLERYGLTETLIVSSNPLDGERRPSTVGRALPGCEVRLADDGEILVRGPSVLPGYWRDAEASTAAFDGEFFRTGDLGTYDEAGYLRISGRKKELIIVGGSNVLPGEVERGLGTVDGIVELAVAGLPDPDRGEIVAAFAVAEPGADPAAAERELRARAEQNLASYKRPRVYHFMDELPRNAMGKIDRSALRARV